VTVDQCGHTALCFLCMGRRDEDSRGFVLTIVPHPGCAEENHVSLDLVVRYPAAYVSAAEKAEVSMMMS
jgi:hypothetical protein